MVHVQDRSEWHDKGFENLAEVGTTTNGLAKIVLVGQVRVEAETGVTWSQASQAKECQATGIWKRQRTNSVHKGLNFRLPAS